MLCDQFHMFTVLCGQIIIHQKHGDDQAGDGTDQKYQKHRLMKIRALFHLRIEKHIPAQRN